MFNLLFGFWGQQSKEETQDLSHISQFFLWIQGDKESFSCQTGDLQWVLGKGMRSNACKIPTPAAVSHLVQLQSGTESSPSPGALFQSPSYVLRRAHYIQFMYHKQVHGSRGLCWDLHLWRSHSTWAPTALLDPCRLLWAKASWIPWAKAHGSKVGPWSFILFLIQRVAFAYLRWNTCTSPYIWELAVIVRYYVTTLYSYCATKNTARF